MMNTWPIIFLMIFSIGAWAAPSANNISEFFKGKTNITNPLELRDPFKAPQLKSDNKTQKEGFFISGKGQYSNIQETKIQNIQDLQVVGVLIGKERRALVSSGGSKDIIVLKEGMKFGQSEAELKAILPGGIILVEKIINVYGQEEYLETVIPISK
jgi:hypothetical protein